MISDLMYFKVGQIPINNMENSMKSLKLTVLCLASALTMTGCGATKGLLAKYDNGSLDYQKSQKIDPIDLPKNQKTAPFVPLYQTPDAVTQLPDFVNEAGTQYKLPEPPRVRK